MRYSAILFDLDGTLIDTIGLYEEALLQALTEIGINATHEQFCQWYTTPLHIREILKMHGKSEHLVPPFRHRRDELYIELLKTKSTWLPGAKDLMDSLRGKSENQSTNKLINSPPSPHTTTRVPLGMITTSWLSYVDAIDHCLGIKRYFDTIITVDDTGNFSKPHPHPLLLACDRLRVEPKDCVYIGDQLFDMEAAHRAGMEGWMVQGTWSPKECVLPKGCRKMRRTAIARACALNGS